MKYFFMIYAAWIIGTIILQWVVVGLHELSWKRCFPHDPTTMEELNASTEKFKRQWTTHVVSIPGRPGWIRFTSALANFMHIPDSDQEETDGRKSMSARQTIETILIVHLFPFIMIGMTIEWGLYLFMSKYAPNN